MLTDKNAQERIKQALAVVAENNPKKTDGKWLEELTVQIAPHIKDWDISQCWPWREWLPRKKDTDIGIDAVASRRSDGKYIAIQCKSRQLDAHNQGAPIHKSEVDPFLSTSADADFVERWVVTNGDNRLSHNITAIPGIEKKPPKLINIANDLLQQSAFTEEECPHCKPSQDGQDSEERRRTKTCMQHEAIKESVRILKEHEQSASGGLPKGQARGKIILPCGTGKTRISLRIIEELTPCGELSIVLCPSIALVAQLRREYLQHAKANMRVLAVCSDQTAGYDPKKEASRNTAADPTLDNSNVSESEVKGKVTTDAEEIAQWIMQGQNSEQISVIFGTYQSGHRVAKSLTNAGVTAKVLIADEAHRTAGLRRHKQLEERLRDFTLCHDNKAFPATYRVYQTATPRVYDTHKVNRDNPANWSANWVIRSMDDESVFGVELYRKSYMEAVANRWLADYRIIALGINDNEAYAKANELARTVETAQTKTNALTTTHFLKGMTLALVLGGATSAQEEDSVTVKSCIAFMNTVAKSKEMTRQLGSDTVRQWVQQWLNDNRNGQLVAKYKLEHLDATSNVASRDAAKSKLAQATKQQPHGIINVGIFGEGTDAPSLSAVAFLEPRKSPIDVIQAVGRAMRTAPDKEMGYIVCPILIPPNVDAEQWLQTSAPEDGWQELGQILLALRAHDSRIEDKLSDLIQLYIPPETVAETAAITTMVAIAKPETGKIRYCIYSGTQDEAQQAIQDVLEGRRELNMCAPLPQYGDKVPSNKFMRLPKEGDDFPSSSEPGMLVTGKKSNDGAIELRYNSVAHGKSGADGMAGAVDITKAKKMAKAMINKGEGGHVIDTEKKKPRRTKKETLERSALLMLKHTGLKDRGNAIIANLLTKSGLSRDRVQRDANLLEITIKEAAHHLREDNLRPALDKHFQLDNLKDESLERQADGCTIAALMMLNAAMLHQRIANGHWLSGISDLESVKNAVNVVKRVIQEWNKIMRHDFIPVLEPAVNAIEAVDKNTGKLAGLERALRHIAAEAQHLAETYADLGADHAGPLFNRVMGNQASDGAFFTRPVAASIAARLTLDACGEQNWANPATWRAHKTVDLACGSGTLLTAILTDIKRRARAQGAGEEQIAKLQKLAVEETIKGLDINPVSLQLAAAQLTAGNREVRYKKMGLHLIPYGPQPEHPTQMPVGTLELLEQTAIVPVDELGLVYVPKSSQAVWKNQDNPELEDAVDAAKDARIVIMNPPFTNRTKMGEKFHKETQRELRKRTDLLEQILVQNDKDMEQFVDKNALEPLFTALADRCLTDAASVMTMINPTVALSAPSSLEKRRTLAQRFHIHTVLTCHQPGNVNLSQNTAINESIVILRRYPSGDDSKPPTRFINLDKLPVDDDAVDNFHRCLLKCSKNPLANGWGEVSEWPAQRMAAGDWTLAIWRSPELAEAAHRYASHVDLRSIKVHDLSAHATGQSLRGSHEPAPPSAPGSFPILKSKGADAQTRIQSHPDEHWIPKKRDEAARTSNGGTYPR